jgi:hypothetical protein
LHKKSEVERLKREFSVIQDYRSRMAKERGILTEADIIVTVDKEILKCGEFEGILSVCRNTLNYPLE